MPRDAQAGKGLPRKVTDEVNDYEEDIERVVGIYAPHLGAHRVHVTRTAEWRIVPKVLAVEPLTLKSGSAAPRSPVNNCGKLTGGGDPVMTPTPSEQAAAVLNLTESGVIAWDDPEVVTVLRRALKYDAELQNRQQRDREPLKPQAIAPSGRLTRNERMLITRIRVDLAQHGIKPKRWELEALSRGAVVIYEELKLAYPVIDY